MTEVVSRRFLTRFRTLFPFCSTTSVSQIGRAPRSWCRAPARRGLKSREKISRSIMKKCIA